MALLLVDLVAGADWAGRAALALLVGSLVVGFGLASMGPMRAGEKSYPPVDAIEPGGIPVYACAACGTQLVLLRRGSDRPPRHCGEAMRFEVVEEGFDRPDTVAYDEPTAAAYPEDP